MGAVQFNISEALIDKDGFLVDWNEDFRREFNDAGGLLCVGVSFSVLCDRVNIPAHSSTGGQKTYKTSSGTFISVLEWRMANGSILRRASAETKDREMLQVRAVTEAPFTMTRHADGRWHFPFIPEMLDFFRVPEDRRANFVVADLFQASSEEDNKRFLAKAEESWKTRQLFQYETKVRDFQSKFVWVRMLGIPVFEPNGDCVWTGTLRDISSEKLANDNEALLRALITQSHMAVVIVNFDTNDQSEVLYMNQAGEHIFNCPQNEIVGQPFNLFGRVDDVRDPEFSSQILNALRAGKPYEYRVRNRHGKMKWFSCRATHVRTSNDGSSQWAISAADVTERKNAQAGMIRVMEEAEAAQAKAEAASRIKSEFLANMSHEIRTPMNGVLGMIELLLDTPLSEDQRDYAEAVRDSGEILLTIINDILDVSKLEAGKIELESIDFNLVDAVENSVTLLAPRAQDKGVDIAVFIDPEIDRAVRGDPHRIRQILLNLLGNGIKFTDAGCVSVEVTYKDRAPASGSPIVRFEVRDTGIGMHEEVRSGLFEKFFQGDTSITRRFGGTGLGLAISKQLIDLMGGDIGVESRPGQGSTFWFEIPLAPASAPLPDRDYVSANLKGIRAMAVDDISMNLQIISRQLKGFGLDATTCSDAFDAMAELERAWHMGNPYDIVFLDQMMPGLSGEALAERIRAIPNLKETRLVLITSAGYSGARASSCFDRIIEKPLRQRDLVACLTMLFSADEDDDVDAHPPQASAPPVVRLPVPARPLSILLAEDNKINQKFALAVLKKEDHEVDVVENGHQAVDAVLRSSYDVVLMDLQMPELDGFQATKKIRALDPPHCHVHIIALTAHAMEGARESCIESGFDDYLSKPINAAELLKRLRTHAETAGPARTPAADLGALGLDLQQVELVRSIMDEAAFTDQISVLGAEILDTVRRIKGFIEGGDLAGAEAEAHGLVAVAGNYGAIRLSETARALERACARKEGPMVSAKMEEIEPAAQAASDAFAALLKGAA